MLCLKYRDYTGMLFLLTTCSDPFYYLEKKGRRALMGLGATSGWYRQYGSGLRLLGSTTCRALGRLSLGLLRFRWEGQSMFLGKGIRVSAVCLKPRL